jgi:hypothetical protein
MGRIGGGARMGGMRGAHGIGSGPKSVKSAATAQAPKRCIGHSGQSSFTPGACRKSSGAQPPASQPSAASQPSSQPDSGSSILQAILGALAPAAQKVAEALTKQQGQQGKPQQGQQPVAAA